MGSIHALVTSVLQDRKADDLITITIDQKSDIADIMMVASGTSNRHVISLAQHVIESLKSIGLVPMVEGLETGDWVLVDAGNLIIHLFHPDTRAYYKLEKMWGVPNVEETHAQLETL